MDTIQTIFIDKDLFNTNPKHYYKLISQVEPFIDAKYEDIVNQLDKEMYFCLLVKGVETVALCRLIPAKDDGSVYINNPISVPQRFRHQGYAGKCLMSGEYFIAQRKCNKLISVISFSNGGSLALHYKHGYMNSTLSAYDNTLKCWYDYDDIVLEKHLNTRQIDKENLSSKAI